MQTNGNGCVPTHFIEEYKIHLAWAIPCRPPTGDRTGGTEMFWVGQILGWDFPATRYGKTWMNILANLIKWLRIDASEQWCWRRLWRVPWTIRGSNQSILKEISPERSLEGLMLKLKLQYLGHLMQRVDSLEKTLMLGGIGGRRRRGWQRMKWLDSITDSMDMS